MLLGFWRNSRHSGAMLSCLRGEEVKSRWRGREASCLKTRHLHSAGGIRSQVCRGGGQEAGGVSHDRGNGGDFLSAVTATLLYRTFTLKQLISTMPPPRPKMLRRIFFSFYQNETQLFSCPYRLHCPLSPLLSVETSSVFVDLLVASRYVFVRVEKCLRK